MDNFNLALEFTKTWEGNFSDHKNDPGGATKYGVTIHTATAHKIDNDGDGDTDKDDMRNLTLEQAEAIYKVDYWCGAGCDTYDRDFAIALFDTAVNCGVSRAKKWAAESNGDVRTLLEQRTIHYINLNKDPKFQVFFKGWMNRVQDLKRYLDMLEAE